MAKASKEHPNFFETVSEARMRLEQTIVMYDGEPCFVLGVHDHRKDGIFRIYLDRISSTESVLKGRRKYTRCPYYTTPMSDPAYGPLMDAWMDEHPDSGVLRKHMNSPKFNKYRPFPLGMVNDDGSALYVSRQPKRHTQQGLSESHLMISDPSSGRFKGQMGLTLTSESMVDMYIGRYPGALECLSALQDQEVTNSSVAWSREFALIRGPLESLYIAYGPDTVGQLYEFGDNHFGRLSLASRFSYLKETCEEQGLFDEVTVRSF